MSPPPSKRSRVDPPSQSDTASLATRQDKSIYEQLNYPVVMEMKGSYKRDSQEGLIAEDVKMCAMLLEATPQIPDDVLFDDAHFARFLAKLKNRSEAQICIDLHPRLCPSVENLYITGEEKLQGLREGYNDPWYMAQPFYGSCPQPHHTIAFDRFNFTDQQRRKLQIDPNKTSPYTAREELFFPFFTAEVKSGMEGFYVVDNANLNSMSTAMKGTVHLYRLLNRESELHRRILGFSMSHDDNTVQLYAHYPEIRDGELSYWRHKIKTIILHNENGKDRRIPFYFVVNVCLKFAPSFLARLKSVIDQIAEPLQQSQLTQAVDGMNMLGSQEDPGVESRGSGQSDAELKILIESLQKQIEQQRKEAEEQRKEAEEQRKEAEEQRKEAEEQRKEAEEQRKELMQMLKEQLSK